MVLRKPYKFLIKYFKIIHLILTILSVYLLTKTNTILNFFNEYLQSSSIISVFNLTKQLFNSLIFIIPIFVIILISIIIYLLHWKEKPIKYYIFNIIIYVFILLIYLYIYSVCKTLEIGVVDIRVIKIIDDICLVLFLLQTISSIFFVVRALGFDVKKFDFDKEMNFEISEKDNEEFEFELDYDSNKTKRNIKRQLRNAKYIYKENKLIINIIVLFTIIVLSIFIYFNFFVKNRAHKLGESVNCDLLNFTPQQVYITNVDYKNRKITDNYIVTVKFKLKNNSNKRGSLNTERFVLNVNDINFVHTTKYKKDLIDIGNTYNNEEIKGQTENEYLLVYEIPKKYKNKKMTLKFANYNNNYINIRIKPQSFNSNNKKESSIGKTLEINNQLVKDLKIYIDSYGISPRMDVGYNYYINNIIYNSHEYLVPSYTDNYEKTILKLDGEVDSDSLDLPLTFSKLENLVYQYGSIEYTINGETKIMNQTIKPIKPKMVNDSNLYFEIYKEIEKANNITLIFNIRNNIYRYKLK